MVEMENTPLSYSHPRNLSILTAASPLPCPKPRFYVEGDADRNFWINFVSDEYQEIVTVASRCEEGDRRKGRSAKHQVIDIVKKAIFRAANGRPNIWPVLGVVDQDTDEFLEDVNGNLLLYDCEDLEIMILTSPAFFKVCHLCFKQRHGETLGEMNNRFEKLRSMILSAAAIVGSLRLFLDNVYPPERSKPSVNKMDLSRAVTDFENLTVPRGALKELALEWAHAQGPCKWPKAELDNLREAMDEFIHYQSPRVYRRGHDAVQLFHLFIQKSNWEVTKDTRSIEIGQLEKLLVGSFSETHLKKTVIHKRLERWTLEKGLTNLLGF